MEESMERLSTKKEEKTMALYVNNPCYYCLKEVLRSFLRCLGIESTQIKEEEDSSTSLLKPHACALSDAYVAPKDHYYSSSSNTKSSQEGVGDPPPSTSTQLTLNVSSMGRGGPRRTPLTQDPPPQHN